MTRRGPRLIDALDLPAAHGLGLATPYARGGTRPFAAGTGLVVEPDPVDRAVVAAVLLDLGLRTRVLPHGLAVLASAALHRPQVIVVSLAMPRIGAIGVARRLREEPATAGIPVVVGAPPGVLPHPDAAAPLDVAVFLAKPLDDDELREALRRLLERDHPEPERPA